MPNAKKTPLVTAAKLTSSAQAGMWLCSNWQGRPLLVRASKREALRDGHAAAVATAGRACLDLSRFA